jgi:putative transposase
MRRQRQLEGENAKLKRLVADQSLDKAMLQDVVSQPKASVVQ